MGGGEDGLAFELFVQVPMGPPIQSERGTVDETSQVIVFVKVGDAVLHLVCVKVGLHICNLNESLQEENGSSFSF